MGGVRLPNKTCTDGQAGTGLAQPSACASGPSARSGSYTNVAEGDADRMVAVLAEPKCYAVLPILVRATIVARFDLRSTCLPMQFVLLHRAVGATGTAQQDSRPSGAQKREGSVGG